MTKLVTSVTIAVLLGCIGLPMLLISAVLGGSGSCVPAIPVTSGQPGIDRWDPQQVAIAATIVKTGAAKAVPRWGWVVALATAMQEGQMRNLPHLGQNNDHDSIGVFQQRPSQGWGTPEQLADPAYQAERFYEKLLTVPGWEQMPLTQAAQRVQLSAYPTAYAKWTGDAILLADALASTSGSNTSPTAAGSCGATGIWTQPVLAPIVSGFRTESRPGHDGVDLGAARGTPIRAASAGTVSVVRCNVVPESHGCDQDGHPQEVKGCGWYVDIDHASGIVSRACHMLTRPYVQVGDQVVAGQIIGIVGSSGHSSGPHLHFEIHIGGRGPESAINPESFMAQNGAPLGKQ